MAVDQNTIVGLYILYFDRAPDPSGLAFWQAQDLSAEQIAESFAATAEAQAVYPYLASPTLADPTLFITEIYQNAFGLVPDAEGLTFWLNYLATPGVNFATLPLVIAQNASGDGAIALQNRADVALDFTRGIVDANIPFDTAVGETSSSIINTVTADPLTVEAAFIATEQAIADIIAGGGTSRTFTLLQPTAVLTATASNFVDPEGQFLSTADETVNGLIFLNNSFVQDPSTSDNDVLTASILGTVNPNISKIETVKFTGSAGANVNIANITDVKTLEVTTGDLTVLTAETYPVDLAAGYANTLSVKNANTTKDATIELNGTVVGTKIVDINNAANVNLVVRADSTLQSADDTAPTLADAAGKSNFVISGDKNLTLNGGIVVFDNTTDRLDASDLTGKLDLNLGLVSNVKQIVGGKGDDTFSVIAFDDQINGISLNGSEATNTLTVKVGNAVVTALDKVTNINTVIFKEAATPTTVDTVDSLVASGKSLTVDASSFTTKSLTFNGALESDGSFNITGGTQADGLIGGQKDDILAGNGGNDVLFGSLGADQFVLNKLGNTNVPTIKDFNVAQGDIFALSNAAYAGAPAVGSALTTNAVLGAANLATTILVDTNAAIIAANLSNVRFAYDTTNNVLFYDADGNFGVGISPIAVSTLAVAPVGTSFAIVA